VITLTRERLDEILDALQGQPVLVCGDFCLDRYGSGQIKGISRETGQEVPRLHEHLFSPGAAGTVTWNLCDLGAAVQALAVVGEDRYGEVILRELQLRGADTSLSVCDPSRPTPSFEKLQIKHPDGRTRELRVDVGTGLPSHTAAAAVMDNIRRALPDVGAVVVADYDEEGDGVLNAGLRPALSQLAADSDKLFICTSRTHSADFANIALVPNEYELVSAGGLAEVGIFDEIADDLVLRAAEVVLPRLKRPIFCTRGKRGILIFAPEREPTWVPTVPVEGPLDITGAGDSTMSAITMALLAGASLEEAALLGNMAANVTIRKLGITGTATPDELRTIYDDFFRDR